MASNLPEMLVRDLEMSESVFISKDMTAGAPCPVLAVEDLDQLYLAGEHTGLDDSRPHDYEQAIHEGQGYLSFGVADEDEFPVVRKAIEDNSWKRRCLALSSHPIRWEDEVNRNSLGETDSDLSSELSFDAALLPDRTRQQSVATAATSMSVYSDRGSLQSPKQALPMARGDESSWMDLEPDVGDEEEEVHRTTTPLGELARPHTSSGLPARDWKSIAQHHVPTVPRRRSSLGHRATILSAIELPRSGRSSLLLSNPNASSSNRDFAYESDSYHAPHNYSSHHRHHSSLERNECSAAKLSVDPVFSHEQRSSPGEERRAHHIAKSMLDLEGIKAVDESRLARPTSSSSHHQRSADETPSQGNMQTWLESDTRLAVASPLVTKSNIPASPTIPIPPEMMETLKISTACFPETMLLSSSLAIETIRNYSRKLRRSPPTESSALDVFSEPPSPVGQKRWKFPKMRSSRKSHGPPAYGQTGWSGASPPSTPTNVSSPTVSAANWTHIKNIFPLGSDYLCNALYAHIVAYNYVASLCKSHPPPSSSRGSRHPGAPATNSSAGNGTTATAGIIRGPADETRVPKKAASLLGLSHTAAVSRSDLGAPAQRNKILIRESPSTSSELGNIKSNCSQIPGRREFTNSDSSAVADLRDGLGRCIARLVATLKLTGGEQDAPIKGANSEDLDPLLMKMLCELVRCCEEQS